MDIPHKKKSSNYIRIMYQEEKLSIGSNSMAYWIDLERIFVNVASFNIYDDNKTGRILFSISF